MIVVTNLRYSCTTRMLCTPSEYRKMGVDALGDGNGSLRIWREREREREREIIIKSKIKKIIFK